MLTLKFKTGTHSDYWLVDEFRIDDGIIYITNKGKETKLGKIINGEDGMEFYIKDNGTYYKLEVKPLKPEK